MGWIVMGIILFILLNKQGHCASRRRRHREPHDASDYYRMQADLEDMSRRMQAMERNVTDGDDWLRREFRNL